MHFPRKQHVCFSTSGQTSKTKQDFALEKQPCKQEMRHKQGLYKWTKNIFEDEKPVFPLEGPLPRLKLTHSQRGTGFFRNSKPVCISHLFDYYALRGETGFLSEHRRPSQPIISVLEIRWTSSNRPHPERDAAKRPMNICIILSSDNQTLPLPRLPLLSRSQSLSVLLINQISSLGGVLEACHLQHAAHQGFRRCCRSKQWHNLIPSWCTDMTRSPKPI